MHGVHHGLNKTQYVQFAPVLLLCHSHRNGPAPGRFRMMFDLHDMYYFVHVVDHKSITAAARALRLPRTTINDRLNQLEMRLGVRLIDRTLPQLAVTEVGKDFYRHTSAMLQHAEEAELAVRERMTNPGGMVKISVTPATAQFVMRHLIPAFSRKHPSVRLMQRTSNVEASIVAEGFDIAIQAHALPLQDSSLIQRPLAKSPCMLFCSPLLFDDPRALRRPEDIKSTPTLFMLNNGAPSKWTLHHRDGEDVSVPLSPALITDCMKTLKDAAVAGLGVVALPAYACKAELRAGTLVSVLQEWSAGEANLTALVPYGQNRLPSVRALLDFLVEQVPGVVTTE
jgi:DNA-binding transcriptional LysR family regulator